MLLTNSCRVLFPNGHESSLWHISDRQTNLKTRKITFVLMTIGTRGDVQPFIALGKRLQSSHRLYKVVLASHNEYRDWIESHGLEFRELAGNPTDLMKLCVNNGMFSVFFLWEAIRNYKSWIKDLLESAWIAAQDADVIIDTPITMAGFHIAEKLGVPYFTSSLMPWTITREFPHPFASSLWIDQPLVNKLSWRVMQGIFWNGIQPLVNSFRQKTLCLEKQTSGNWLNEKKICFLYSFSETIVSRPADWGPWIELCGYWFLDEPVSNWEPSTQLVEFLDRTNDPRKIVYIGFGSIIMPEWERVMEKLVESVQLARIKAVICMGWFDRLSRNPSSTTRDFNQLSATRSVYFDTSIPHDWLFPRLDAVVHHGGSGTTAAGLRFSLPTIVRPFFGDQFFWAKKITELGVGYQLRDFQVEKFANLLRKVCSERRVKSNAARIGRRLRLECGVNVAVRKINSVLHS